MAELIIEKDGFNRIMTSLPSFVSAHDSRKVLNYIKLEHKAGTGSVTAVALDGFMLCKLEVPAMGNEDFDVMMPVCARTQAKSVKITLDGDKLIFDHENLYQIIYNKIEGQYINWRQIVPTNNDQYSVAVNPRYLAKALKSLPKDARYVVLKFGSNVMPILIEDNKDTQMLVLPIRISQ